MKFVPKYALLYLAIVFLPAVAHAQESLAAVLGGASASGAACIELIESTPGDSGSIVRSLEVIDEWQENISDDERSIFLDAAKKEETKAMSEGFGEFECAFLSMFFVGFDAALQISQ